MTDSYDLIRVTNTAASAISKANQSATEAAQELARHVNHLAGAVVFALDALEHLTSDEFATGGDRRIRQVLVEALERCGRATPTMLAVYLPAERG